MTSQPDSGGHFGTYGGRYVPEVLMSPLEELELAFNEARQDPAFQAELDELLRNFAGRPTPLYCARRLSEKLGGARIYLKREDLLHTGAHKINNCLGQILLASTTVDGGYRDFVLTPDSAPAAIYGVPEPAPALLDPSYALRIYACLLAATRGRHCQYDLRSTVNVQALRG